MIYLDRIDYFEGYVTSAAELAKPAVIAGWRAEGKGSGDLFSDAAIDAAIDNAAMYVAGALPSELRN